jgi:hypothetical protein
VAQYLSLLIICVEFSALFGELFDQSVGLFQVDGVEAFGEPTVENTRGGKSLG